MTITLKLNEEAASLLEGILEEEISTGARMSGPERQQARALLSDLHSVSPASTDESQTTLLQQYPEPLFRDGLVPGPGKMISRYSREEALADGTLVDVSDMGCAMVAATALG